MAKYKHAGTRRDSDDESTADESEQMDDESESMCEDEITDVDSEDETEGADKVKNKNSEISLKHLLDDQATATTSSEADVGNCDNGDALLNNVAALAQSIQPKGNTLSSTNVVTPIPILLRHTLREYQHIGLDWLVTMDERKLNGILADEMGLGKTIQTIALLAHLACVQGNWGPHLIIVPSSVMLNWEMEFKKWCPGFKIMTYYGSQKERKMKRIGWTKINAFHVCITSYKLVIQDHQSFRRKKWKYLILDEAQNIKNFKSQRWQLLLNFSTERRLLLTGTPLQNNMMELWSLMHFLMPNFFESHRTFEELFSKPMSGMVEGNLEYNESIIIKLHKVLRPFLLRRLKSEVEKQMPQKHEHVVMCRLSKRQRFLYDDFMSRTKTKETLASGNLLSVINVLMQLRKVCNHPNLFEVRPTMSPFRMDQVNMTVPSMVYNIVQEYNPLENIDLVALNLVFAQLETCLTAFVAYRMKQLITPKKLIEEIDSAPELPPICPRGKYKIHLKIKPLVQHNLTATSTSCITSSNLIKVGTSPAFRADGTRLFNNGNNNNNNSNNKPNTGGVQPMEIDEIPTNRSLTASASSSASSLTSKPVAPTGIYQTPSGQIYFFNTKQNVAGKSNLMVLNQQHQQLQSSSNINQPLASAVIEAVRCSGNSIENIIKNDEKSSVPSEFHKSKIEIMKNNYRNHILQMMSKINQRKCNATPLYGEDVIDFLTKSVITSNFPYPSSSFDAPFIARSSLLNRTANSNCWSLEQTIKNVEERSIELKEVFEKFVFVVPAVSAPVPSLSVTHNHPTVRNQEERRIEIINRELGARSTILHPISSAMTTQVSKLDCFFYNMRLQSVLNENKFILY